MAGDVESRRRSPAESRTEDFEDYLDLARHDQPDLPAILADAEQLKQVYLNLIDNTLDAMPEGAGFRSTLSGSPEQRMVVVRIKDSGPGMPEEVQRRIFEPLFSTKDAGTGLGLCIAASVMSRHHGRLVVESSSKQGTVIAVQIPAAS